MSQKLLIVWVYYPAVGHVAECIEVAANYHAANPNLEIHILLNSKTPFIIVKYCDFIVKTHTVEVNIDGFDKEIVKDLNQIGFDYLIFPKRLKYTPQDYPKPLLDFNLFLQKNLISKVWAGYNDTPTLDKEALMEKPYSPFRINIPKDKITFPIPQPEGFPRFAVILKGASQQSIWPSLRMWKRLLCDIKIAYPEAVFFITGITNAHCGAKDNETDKKNKIDHFIRSIPGAFNCYDIGLENQLGLIQQSDILLSPHTGFAIFAPCMGTPWLALSGGLWAEHMPAGIPFYSVMPTCTHYPCHNGDMKLECRLRIKLRQPIKCMADLKKKENEVLIGIKKLLTNGYTYKEAFADYENSAISNKVNMKKLWRIAAFNSSQE
jgi:hypothetical protein